MSRSRLKSTVTLIGISVEASRNAVLLVAEPPYLVVDKSNEALETHSQSVELNRISEFVHTLLRVHSSKTELQFRLLFLVRVLSRRKAKDEMRWI